MSTAVVSAVPEQISEQARLQPHSTALHRGDKDLSYGELDRRADQVADYLRPRARLSGGTVAICKVGMEVPNTRRSYWRTLVQATGACTDSRPANVLGFIVARLMT